MTILQQQHPNVQEITKLFEKAFLEFDDRKEMAENQNQDLEEWFDVRAMIVQIQKGDGYLVEARDEVGTLIGAAFVAKQNPVTFPDGRKAELFIMAVSPQARRQGIGSQMLLAAETAARTLGATSMIVNTHIVWKKIHTFYESRGYHRLGTLKNYYDNGDAVFFMKKLVENPEWN